MMFFAYLTQLTHVHQPFRPSKSAVERAYSKPWCSTFIAFGAGCGQNPIWKQQAGVRGGYCNQLEEFGPMVQSI